MSRGGVGLGLNVGQTRGVGLGGIETGVEGVERSSRIQARVVKRNINHTNLTLEVFGERKRFFINTIQRRRSIGVIGIGAFGTAHQPGFTRLPGKPFLPFMAAT
jgi:hypothetical protein